MPLPAGALPVAIAAVAAGVMLGKTETASQTASPSRRVILSRCVSVPDRRPQNVRPDAVEHQEENGFGETLWCVIAKAPNSIR